MSRISRRDVAKLFLATPAGFLLTEKGSSAAESPKGIAIGREVDLAGLGRSCKWGENPGIQWDEPRRISRVEVEFEQILPDDSLRIEYWVSSWPAAPLGGWTETDSPWQGEWRPITAHREEAGGKVIFRFAPLSESENPNARNIPGFTPSFRQTLKLRLNFGGKVGPYSALRAYGYSRWNMREINVQSGCEGKERLEIEATAYNGTILESNTLEADPPGLRLKVLYAEHFPSWDTIHRTEEYPFTNDRTILTIRARDHAFGVSVDDLIRRKAVYVRVLGVFLGDAADSVIFSTYMKSGSLRVGEDIFSRTSRNPEQTLSKATAEIPPLAFAARTHSSHESYQYVPLGFPGTREKYGFDFNGDVFISKVGVKALKEDLACMLWDGDQINFRLGTGLTPDFREWEGSSHQSLLEGYLPLVTTTWQADGIDYKEQAYATLLEARLDEPRLRGDEPTLLLLKLTARNKGVKPKEAFVWFHVSPQERFELADGMLLSTGDQNGRYPRKRLRAILEATDGRFALQDLPPESAYVGQAVRWSTSLPAQTPCELSIKIPFRTMTSPSDLAKVRRVRFATRLDETMAAWREMTSRGMQITLADEEFGRFSRAWLQHVLVTFYRDVPSGYDMLPAGTFDYNVFPTETCIQVRLLEMRGLHDLAWRFLRPIVELQGTHPFAGRFTHTGAIFHGTRVDANHDYTMGNYNFSHGWVLWCLGAHYFFTRDEQWLRSVLPRMLRAMDWIIEERKLTMRKGADGRPVPEYGLLPAGDLEDNEEWRYWFGVNAYTYWGMNLAAEAISAIDPGEGSRLKKEASAYRSDIRRAAFQAMAIAPVVPVRDGTFIPYIPPRLYLHGRDLGWFRNAMYGAHDLVDCGVFGADEPVSEWIVQDYEENLYMAEDALCVPDRDWFSRGGIASLEPNEIYTALAYLQRDQVPQALRNIYGGFVSSYYWDVSAFTEWMSTLGIGGGPFFKTPDEAAWLTVLRMMLVRESGDRLYLNSGAPRSWFLAGRVIEVKRAATLFGELSFRIDSHRERRVIQAQVSTPQRNRPREVVLRVRHPGGKPMTRVEINGHAWSAFDAKRETISLPPSESRVAAHVYF